MPDEVLTDRPGVFDFNVTRCRYAETYRAKGLGGTSDMLSCERVTQTRSSPDCGRPA
jgi:hypothetical protein